MPKFSALVRNFSMTDEFKVILASHIIKDGEVKPGQLWQKGAWLGLSYLKSFKYNSFNPSIWDYDEKEVDATRMVQFKIIDKKILILGGKSEANQIEMYFQALVMDKANAKGEIDFNTFFKMEMPTVDLALILKKLEEAEKVAGFQKIKMKKVEIVLGHIDNCTIKTGDDYGKSSKSVQDPNEGVTGMELALKQTLKTTAFIDINGVVRVTTKSPDLDVEVLAAEMAALL